MPSEASPLLDNRPLLLTEDDLLPSGRPASTVDSDTKGFRSKCAHFLNSKTLQWNVIGLTLLDGCFTLSDIGYDFLKDPICLCDNSCPPTPDILVVCGFISSCITGLFVAELPLTLYAFGFDYYTRAEHHWMHCFDATVILLTFIMEIVLRGREAEIAGLLIILRLWRLIKLVTGVIDLEETQIQAHEETWKEMFDREKEALMALWEKEKAMLIHELGKVKEELHLVKTGSKAPIEDEELDIVKTGSTSPFQVGDDAV